MLFNANEVVQFCGPVIDVRAPVEYARGHIPGAINIPLLSDDQRHQVGLCFRESGKEAAMLLGLQLVGPTMSKLAQAGLDLGEPVVIYCHRGGKRSQSVEWLWKQLGIQVHILEGGYKQFRQWALQTLTKPIKAILLAGPTGVGKTDFLMLLQELGDPILDLEGLASHKGSAFGAIGEERQPTQIQFENRLAIKMNELDANHIVWIESESRRIGRINIPETLWASMQVAQRVYVHRNRIDRIERLCHDYRKATVEEITLALNRIRKRLGPESFKESLETLEQGDLSGVVDLVLKYYDRAYDKHRHMHKEKVLADINLADDNALQLLRTLRQQACEKEL